MNLIELPLVLAFHRHDATVVVVFSLVVSFNLVVECMLFMSHSELSMTKQVTINKQSFDHMLLHEHVAQKLTLQTVAGESLLQLIKETGPRKPDVIHSGKE
jgi:hypothetical protein